MDKLLSGNEREQKYLLATLEPGQGKTETLCAFLRHWKAARFNPTGGALIVLATRLEIRSCIERSGLEPEDYAVLVQQDHELNSIGSQDSDSAPVLFTTQEMLRLRCSGGSFAEVAAYHFQGQPRSLRVWDEAFLPGSPVAVRKDLITHPLLDLRDSHPAASAILDSFATSLVAGRFLPPITVPAGMTVAYSALRQLYGNAKARRWEPLAQLAGRPAVVVDTGGHGLCLAASGRPLPADFAPALILDASGRVRDAYRTMEAAGTLRRLETPTDPQHYRRLRLHHWNRSASRSKLDDAEERERVLKMVAEKINASGDDEPWLVLRPKERDLTAGVRGSYSIQGELSALVSNPDRLEWLHWGNHHGTNAFRHIRRVMVIGLWSPPREAHAALHLAAGGAPSTVTEPGFYSQSNASEQRHSLLQGICRASIRQGEDCEAYIVGKLAGDPAGLLRDTFPGAEVTAWKPEALKLTGSATRVAEAIDAALVAQPAGSTVTKASLRDAVGGVSSEGLRKVIRQPAFAAWVAERGLVETTRGFALAA